MSDADQHGENDCIGADFQRRTEYTRDTLGGWRLDWSRQPPLRREHGDAPRVELEPPARSNGPGLWTTLQQRHSVREYGTAGISLAELSQLLWAADGATAAAPGLVLRTAPSAGGLYPIETYVAAHHVDGLPAGIWHYDVFEHALYEVRAGDQRLAVARAALDQPIAFDAAAVFLWSAVFARSTWKYRQRGYRYVYMEAGHIAQNVALAAVGMGLATCQIAALYDAEANGLVGADGQSESVIYLSTLARVTAPAAGDSVT
jgi:SagB-type dehydrogenase family enzyme